jgi:hypothetical protein
MLQLFALALLAARTSSRSAATSSRNPLSSNCWRNCANACGSACANCRTPADLACAICVAWLKGGVTISSRYCWFCAAARLATSSTHSPV